MDLPSRITPQFKRFAVGVAILIVVAFVLKTTRTPHPLEIMASKLGKVVPKGDITNRTPSNNPHFGDEAGEHVMAALEFPLIWDEQNGEYLIEFKIANTTFMAVPDTGSSYVILASVNCKHCTSSEGLYDESGINTGKSETIAYGSQTDKITWFIDDLSVSGQMKPLKLEFGSVEDVSGGSNLNVFGLAGSTGFHEKTPFVDQIFFNQQALHPAFYFNFSKTNPTLTMGQEYPDKGSGKTVKVYNAREFERETDIDFGVLNYYLIKLTSVKIDGQPVLAFPPFCMVDTGSTNTLVSGGFGRRLVSAKTVVFEFGELHLQYDLRAHDVEVADWLESKPFDNTIMILGNKFMREKILSFDLLRSELTVV